MPKQPDCMQHLSTAALLQKQYQACMLMQHTRKDTSSPRHLLLVLEGLFLSFSLSCESSVLLHRIEFSDVHKVSVMTSLCARPHEANDQKPQGDRQVRSTRSHTNWELPRWWTAEKRKPYQSGVNCRCCCLSACFSGDDELGGW